MYKYCAPADKTGDSERATLKVTGMMCEFCARKIERSLCGTAGVVSASADLAAGSVDVVYCPAQATVDDIKRTIKGAGYGVSET